MAWFEVDLFMGLFPLGLTYYIWEQFIFYRYLACWSGPPVDGPKDPWLRVLSLPGRFVGDPASLARENIFFVLHICTNKLNKNFGRWDL